MMETSASEIFFSRYHSRKKMAVFSSIFTLYFSLDCFCVFLEAWKQCPDPWLYPAPHSLGPPTSSLRKPLHQMQLAFQLNIQ